MTANDMTSNIATVLERRRRLAQHGMIQRGWKIGFDRPAGQQLLGIDRPLVGLLTSSSRIDEHSQGMPSPTGALTIEAEIAVIVDDVAPTNRARSTPAHLALAIEVVDLTSTSLREVVASNVCHVGYAVGRFRAVDELPPTLSLEVRIGTHSTTVEVSLADACERARAAASEIDTQLVAWGAALAPGDLVLCGAWHATDLAVDDRGLVDAGALGQISFHRDRTALHATVANETEEQQ